MDDKPTLRRFEPPKPDKRDKVSEIVRVTTSAGAAATAAAYLPPPAAEAAAVGATELFSRVFAPPWKKRLEKWREDVAGVLRDLMENRGVTLEELKSSDVLLDTVMHATEIALRNSQEEKREALRNAILNAGLPSAPEEALQQIFLNNIDTLTVWHLKILKFVQDIRGWAQESNFFSENSGGRVSNVLESAFPELRGRRTFYLRIWSDLHQRGLVGQSNIRGVELKQIQAKMTSELGDQFLRFIEEPE